LLTMADALAGAPEVEKLFADAEAKGWSFSRVTSDLRVRMHCPCTDEHNMWFDARPETSGYEARQRLLLTRRTCWREGE